MGDSYHVVSRSSRRREGEASGEVSVHAL